MAPISESPDQALLQNCREVRNRLAATTRSLILRLQQARPSNGFRDRLQREQELLQQALPLLAAAPLPSPRELKQAEQQYPSWADLAGER